MTSAPGLNGHDSRGSDSAYVEPWRRRATGVRLTVVAVIVLGMRATLSAHVLAEAAVFLWIAAGLLFLSALIIATASALRARRALGYFHPRAVPAKEERGPDGQVNKPRA